MLRTTKKFGLLLVSYTIFFASLCLKMKDSDIPFEKFKKKCYVAKAPKEGDFIENTQLLFIALLDYIPYPRIPR